MLLRPIADLFNQLHSPSVSNKPMGYYKRRFWWMCVHLRLFFLSPQPVSSSHSWWLQSNCSNSFISGMRDFVISLYSKYLTPCSNSPTVFSIPREKSPPALNMLCPKPWNKNNQPHHNNLQGNRCLFPSHAETSWTTFERVSTSQLSLALGVIFPLCISSTRFLLDLSSMFSIPMSKLTRFSSFWRDLHKSRIDLCLQMSTCSQLIIPTLTIQWINSKFVASSTVRRPIQSPIEDDEELDTSRWYNTVIIAEMCALNQQTSSGTRVGRPLVPWYSPGEIQFLRHLEETFT